MENEEIEYLQPTKFWRIASLQENWAHLSDEVDEFLEVALPCLRKQQKGTRPTSDEMNAAAMELADIQIMCNTIIQMLDECPVKEKDLPQRYMACPNFSEQIMILLETKAKASSEAKAIIRGVTAYSDNLAGELVKVIFAAEAAMMWIYETRENRDEIRKMAYLKNKKRGYYEL